eukprot:SRR837773.22159.p1 GENE.SRR837773.22159~~SRR837773.22159.p1  ORF type:complete len:220 (+),score=27.03 SRR837773.22159:3-662(+)
MLQYVLGVIIIFPYGICLRRWLRDKAFLLEHLEHFEVRSCICAVESDREVVYRNIASLMRAAYDMAADAPQDEALDAFDAMVHTELSQPLRATLGRFAFEYKHYVFLGIVATVPAGLDSLEGLTDGTPILLLVAYNTRLFFWTFCAGRYSWCFSRSALNASSLSAAFARSAALQQPTSRGRCRSCRRCSCRRSGGTSRCRNARGRRLSVTADWHGATGC